MATVSITAGKATGGSHANVPMIMFAGSERATQSITSSGSNQISTVIGSKGETVMIASSGGDVKLAVDIGANPDATTAYQYIVSAGAILPLYCDTNDTRFAVVDL